MSRWEFMRQLEELLSDISPNEREEALQYYNDYFNDAGRDNEQEVIVALGSPEQVAKIVREGLEDGGSQGEFTEKGFSNHAASLENEIIKKEQGASGGSQGDTDSFWRDGDTQRAQSSQSTQSTQGTQSAQSEFSRGESTQTAGDFGNSGGEYQESSRAQKKDMPGWAIALIVIGCIIASPVLLSVITAVLGLLLGGICTILAVVLGIGLAATILFVVAVALVAAGLGCLFAHPLVGAGLLGGGLICGALGILFLLGTVLLAGKGIPAVCRGIAYLYHCIFDRKKGAAA